MMERISIFNYEAFYLDYLEGTLSEADTQLLLGFLDEHPELRVDIDELPALTPHESSRNSAFIEQLKKQEDDERVPLVDQVIAYHEGLLSPEEKHQLESQEQATPLLQAYQKVYLKPVLSEVYVNKQGLKRRGGLVLWPWYAAAASVAICLLALSTWKPNTTINDVVYAHDSLMIKNQQPDDIVSDKVTSDNYVYQTSSSGQAGNKNTAANSSKSINRATVDKLKIERPNIALAKNTASIIQQPPTVSPTPNEQSKGSDNMMYAALDSKEPIQPITKRIAKATNTPIQLKTTENRKSKRKGFFLKIGDFEVEHKPR